MIDWHSHILPMMDDGSRSVAQSLQMLSALSAEGISCAVLTPHFYANRDSVDSFLSRRAERAARLREEMTPGLPDLRLGAEVYYYPGIGKMEGLDRLTVEGTRLLLLEMPFSRWTEYTVKEILDLASTGGLTVVLAHIDRYLHFQKRGVLEELCDAGVLVQANASFFYELAHRRRALSLFSRGLVHFLGSDCHNMTTRPPRIAAAYRRIAKSFGPGCVNDMNEFGRGALRYIP
jgi:protein-tyrosine phosphatase